MPMRMIAHTHTHIYSVKWVSKRCTLIHNRFDSILVCLSSIALAHSTWFSYDLNNLPANPIRHVVRMAKSRNKQSKFALLLATSQIVPKSAHTRYRRQWVSFSEHTHTHTIYHWLAMCHFFMAIVPSLGQFNAFDEIFKSQNLGLVVLLEQNSLYPFRRIIVAITHTHHQPVETLGCVFCLL